MTASVNPLRPKLPKSALKVVTMVTTPKSAGIKSRPRITVLITWAPSDPPEVDMVTAAPRTAWRRMLVTGDMERNAPLLSNGLVGLSKDPNKLVSVLPANHIFNSVDQVQPPVRELSR